MTIWKPSLTPGQQKYIAIADALERDISDGILQPGDKLPTHRELADTLGVTVGTITRAYGEAERRELTVGEVGRGTFVRKPDDGAILHRWGVGGVVPAAMVDMRHSIAPELRDLEQKALESAFSTMASTATSDLLRMPGDSAFAAHKKSGAEWLRMCDLDVETEEVLVSSGIQHGLAVSLMALMEPRDVLLTEEFTYPGLRSLASILGVRLRPVSMDDQGVLPESIERACRTEPRPKALYVVPTIQNPTCGTLSIERREAVAELAEQYDLTIIEDHVHALLPPERPTPITSMAPESSISLASPSKSIAPGIRVGFIKAPAHLRSKILTAINSTIWTVPPITAELFSIWMKEGILAEIMTAKRLETSKRQRIVDEYTKGLDVQRDRFANHFWLRLPEAWTEQGFVAAARELGVLIPGSSTFAVRRDENEHAVRVAIGTASLGQLRRGLRTLSDLLATQETPSLNVI